MQNNFNSFINPEHGESLNLSFSCRNLKNKDVGSASDPQLFLYHINKGQKLSIGVSEKVGDTLNPDFSTNFKVFYHFEFKTNFEVELWDIDKNNSKDFLGKASFELGEVVGKRKEDFKMILLDKKNKKTKSSLIIKFEKARKSKTLFSFKFKCQKVEDIEFFSKSDPFLKFYKHKNIEKRTSEDLELKDPLWKLTYQSEFYKDNLNPSFNKFTILDFDFCSMIPDLALKAEVWDYSKKGKHSLIGHLFFCFKDILNGRKEFSFKSKRKKNKNAGKLILEYLDTSPFLDFIDYLNGGLILNNFIAIDFTLSNSEPKFPNSLHYISESPNQYQLALESITSIILNYDFDKKIPVFGFGGKYQGGTSHCFPLSGNDNNCEGYLVEGVLNLYRFGIQTYPLSAPTNFSPIIQKAIQISKTQSQTNAFNYQILTIITDGEITDLKETILNIVEASFFPISIIIIGVGDANFKSMNVLDGDGDRLRDFRGRVAERDIVQFVPFRKFGFDSVRLAAETLGELPGQILEYYRMRKIYPKSF